MTVINDRISIMLPDFENLPEREIDEEFKDWESSTSMEQVNHSK
jgi:hypothetical protein